MIGLWKIAPLLKSNYRMEHVMNHLEIMENEGNNNIIIILYLIRKTEELNAALCHFNIPLFSYYRTMKRFC